MIAFSAIVFSSIEDFQFVSPVPGSELNTRETSIIIREGSDIDYSTILEENIEVTGSKSGIRSGELIFSTDRKTLIFKPDSKFLPGETVSVSIKNSKLPEATFEFKITPLEEKLNYYEFFPGEGLLPNKSTGSIAFEELPEDFPAMDTKVLGETAEGYIFLAVYVKNENTGHYMMMLNNDGTPYYYKKIPNDKPVFDFKMQANGYFSYAQTIEQLTFTGGGNVTHYIMDNSFTVVDSFQMGNGYIAEGHDFELLPNGHALMLSYDLQPMDLSEYGGAPRAFVSSSVIQEVDADKNVIFQWRSLDYYDIEDSYTANFNNLAFDPIHVNSIHYDYDGNILITPLGLREITKINRNSGEIMWRLGGKNNQFEWIGENAEFSQGHHDVTRLDNGNILLFDNTSKNSGMTSRAVEYNLDLDNMTATLAWEFAPDPPVFGPFMASSQRLPNGNTLIGWGGGSLSDSLAVTEVTHEGEVVFELRFSEGSVASYRAYRFPFTEGKPQVKISQFEVQKNGVYDFSSPELGETCMDIKINDINGEGYNELIVEKYDYAALNPKFEGDAPWIEPKKFIINGFGVSLIKMNLLIDYKCMGLNNPEEFTIYGRDKSNEGVFMPLPTTVDNVNIIAEAEFLGEFILCKDLEVQLPFTPFTVFPENGGTANENLPVTFEWGTYGIVQSYSFQLATDPDFLNIVSEESDLKEALYKYDGLEQGIEYHWRVKTHNSAGESDWSTAASFTTTPQFLRLVQPLGGEVWEVDSSYFIAWDDNIEEDVILLISNDDFVSEIIIDTVESSGGFSWQISDEITPGLYVFAVKSVEDDELISMSDDYFTIDPASSVEYNREAFDIFLHQNYPNPFDNYTRAKYEIDIPGNVRLDVFNSLGRKVYTVFDRYMSPGIYDAEFSFENLESGTYYIRLQMAEQQVTRQCILIK